MGEWFKPAVLKTAEPQGSVGSNPTASAIKFGGMAEWSIAPVLKTGGPKGPGGSNPSPTAKYINAIGWRIM